MECNNHRIIGDDKMLGRKKMSDTEFEVMKVVWSNDKVPITTNLILDKLGKKRHWKLPTILSLMTRLVEKEYLKTEKNGKERTYYPIVKKEDYLKNETKRFLKSYHENSISNFVDILYSDEKMTSNDVKEILKILERGQK